MMMAGVHHITIAPPLLEALRQKSGAKHVDSLFQSDTPADQAVPNLRGLIYDEAAFRMAMTEHDDGYGEIKMIHVCALSRNGVRAWLTRLRLSTSSARCRLAWKIS